MTVALAILAVWMLLIAAYAWPAQLVVAIMLPLTVGTIIRTRRRNQRERCDRLTATRAHIASMEVDLLGPMVHDDFMRTYFPETIRDDEPGVACFCPACQGRAGIHARVAAFH